MAKKTNKNELGSDAGFNKKLWWIVAAVCVLLVAGAVMMVLYRKGAFKPSDKPADKSDTTPEPQISYVLPPVRTGAEQKVVDPKLGKGMTLESAVKLSEAVLLVRVGDWLGETDEQTLYECTVMEKLKGDIGEKFVLAQDGTSKATIPDYPLFTGGNELLVFLVPSKAQLDAVPEGEKVYELVGSYTTMFYSTALETGEDRYAVTRCEAWLKRMPRDVPNMGSLNYLIGTVYPTLAIKDPIWLRYSPEYRMIYDYQTIADYIRSLL